MPAPDAIVIGGGLAGLTAALACADRGLHVALVTEVRAGSASEASAGVLGPSIGRGPKGGRVGRFMFAALDRYPRYLEQLRSAGGIGVPTVTGAIEVALNETHFAELKTRSTNLPATDVLDARQVAALEPSLVPVAGALYHHRDGAVDVAVLIAALHAAAAAHTRIVRVAQQALALGALQSDAPHVTLADGTQLSAPHIVLAAGAWSAGIAGLPRAIPLRPVKGEVAIARDVGHVRHVVFGAGGYLVPRGADLLVGATSEDAGFDARPTEWAARELRTIARTILRDEPGLAAPFAAQWVGLRPMTPDGYPILGRDPDAPALIHACGYSRNGVLLSPLAAECVAAIVAEDAPAFDLTAFSVSRFTG